MSGAALDAVRGPGLVSGAALDAVRGPGLVSGSPGCSPGHPQHRPRHPWPVRGLGLGSHF